MYISLIIFFISLTSIIIMIGRKLASLPNGEITEGEYAHPFVPDFQKIRHLTAENIKKYGRLSVVMILRLQVKSANFLKYKYEEIKAKISKLNRKKNENGEVKESVEVSKFLKMVSDYKGKIREIKNKITEEEEEKKP